MHVHIVWSPFKRDELARCHPVWPFLRSMEPIANPRHISPRSASGTRSHNERERLKTNGEGRWISQSPLSLWKKVWELPSVGLFPTKYSCAVLRLYIRQFIQPLIKRNTPRRTQIGWGQACFHCQVPTTYRPNVPGNFSWKNNPWPLNLCQYLSFATCNTGKAWAKPQVFCKKCPFEINLCVYIVRLQWRFTVFLGGKETNHPQELPWDAQTDVHGRPPSDHDLLWESMATWGEVWRFWRQPRTYCVQFGSFITGTLPASKVLRTLKPNLKTPSPKPLGFGTLVHRLQAHLRGVPRVNLIRIIGKQQFLA